LYGVERDAQWRWGQCSHLGYIKHSQGNFGFRVGLGTALTLTVQYNNVTFKARYTSDTPHTIPPPVACEGLSLRLRSRSYMCTHTDCCVWDGSSAVCVLCGTAIGSGVVVPLCVPWLACVWPASLTGAVPERPSWTRLTVAVKVSSGAACVLYGTAIGSGVVVPLCMCRGWRAFGLGLCPQPYRRDRLGQGYHF